MFDRFRDLEKAGGGRRLDVVLMATVSSFEALKHPTRHELKQFCELFTPLFRQVDRDTQRTAAAALSRCPRVPRTVVRLIVEQPVEVAAPFLANAAALDDAEITDIVTTHPPSHARALARRRTLSEAAVSALVATGDQTVLRSLAVRALVVPEAIADGTPIEPQQENEEALRHRLREMVGKRRRLTAAADVPNVAVASPQTVTRLNRFADEHEALFFTTALADALGCAFPFAERIMLDISGERLAGTLTAIGFTAPDTARALQSFFPHLRQRSADKPDAWALAVRADRAAAATDLQRRLAASHAGHGSHAPIVAESGRRAPARPAENHAENEGLPRDVFDVLKRA